MKQKRNYLLLVLALLCISIHSLAAVKVGNVYYNFQQGWSYGYSDANGNWQNGDYVQYAAIVTFVPDGETNTYQGALVIPGTVTNPDDGIDYTVVEIDYGAFRGCGNLTSLQLPASVKCIRSNAFEGCANLSTLTMPGVEIIEGYVFSGCGLTTLNLPKTIKAINVMGGATFGDSNLTSISIDAANTIYKSDDGVLFNKNMTAIVSFPVKRGGTYRIPSTVTTLPDHAFPCGTTLDELIIPSSVTRIESSAFNCTPSIKKLTIEDSENELFFGGDGNLVSIEDLYIGRNLKFSTNCSPFSNLYSSSSLYKVGLGSKVTSMPKCTFRNCYSIREVNYDGTISEWCCISFADADATPFGKSYYSPILHLKGSPLHSQVNIPEGITKIGAYAFYGQDGVSTVIVPKTVTTIEPYAFSGVGVVYINASSVISLADTNAFDSGTIIIFQSSAIRNLYKADATWAKLGDNLHTEGFLTVTVDLTAMSSSPALLPALNALEKVSDEYRINILTNLKIRGTMNGYDILMIRTKMPKLRELDLSEATILDNDGGFEYYTGYHTTANTISPYTFYKISNLRKVILPQNITSIGSNAFAECPNLREVLYMPETCTTIESYAFSQSGLRSMVIGKGVKTIGYYAFSSCGNLESVTFQKGLETIESGAFQNCYNLKNSYFDESDKHYSQISGMNSSTSLVFPSTLKRIGNGAFYSCGSLKNIDFAEGLIDIEGSAFSCCSQLQDVHLPTSLRNIREDAFRSCYNLKNVHVSSMLHEIGDNAFKDCGLQSVYAYPVVPIQINQNTFDYNGVNLYAPESSYYAYYINTQWSQFLDVLPFDAKYSEWYTPANTDIEIDVATPIAGNHTGDMEPGSGIVFVGDGEQLVKKLILNWQHGANYPALIENNNLGVEELRFIMNVYPGRWYFFSFPFRVPLKNVQFTNDTDSNYGYDNYGNYGYDNYGNGTGYSSSGNTGSNNVKGKWVWRYYDAEARAKGESGWKNVEGDYLEPNVGYIFQCNTTGDLDMPIDNPDFATAQVAGTRGTRGVSGDKAVNLKSYEAANPEDASWNFIGNPNLSYYALDDLAADFSAPVTVWDPEQQTYTAVVPGDDSYDFHPFQAFFIQKPAGSDEMTFRGENRATYSQAAKQNLTRQMSRAAQRINENHLIVNVEISDGTMTDKTRVVFDPSKSDKYERGSDAAKFMSIAKVPQVYTLDVQNVKYAVNNLPDNNREVRLGVVAPADGVYTINISRMDNLMALKDKATGTIHDFSKGAYTFQTEAGTIDDRFVLTTRAFDVTGISEAGIDGLDINAYDGGVSINGIANQPVSVYNVNGMRMGTLTASGNMPLEKGTYIISAGNKTSKVLVK